MFPFFPFPELHLRFIPRCDSSRESTPCKTNQPNEAAAFCLQQTSLYFTCLANGNSQMYHSSDLMRCIAEAGLKVVEDRDGVGIYHTLLKCRKG